MTNKNIFNAIRSIDEELILGASTSEKAPGAKRKILLKALTSAAAVILVISLSIGGAMMMRDDGVGDIPEDNNKEDKGWLNNGWHDDEPTSKMFYSIEEFDAYRNGPDNVKGEYHYFDNSLYVNFDSIIPNSEIGIIVLHPENNYELRYFDKSNPSFSIDFCIVEDYVLSEGGFYQTYIMDCRIEDLKDIPHNGYTNYVFVVDGIEVLYQFSNYSDKIGVVYISFIIENQLFEINSPFCKNNSPAQQKFIDAFRTEAGTSAMLNRIKALIPTSDESDNTQENDSADKNGTVTSNDSGSTTNQPVSEPSYVGETGDETDYEDEEYLYPEDYEFPVIPGISPDWKPNRNGKYPLKDGYTREEMTLIVACAIELDFGDMTDEEISKIDFIIIDDEEETEDNTEQ